MAPKMNASQRQAPLITMPSMNPFTQHPHSAGETYLEHGRFALKVAFFCLWASLAAAVHAIFPFLFKETAGRIIRDLIKRLNSRK